MEGSREGSSEGGRVGGSVGARVPAAEGALSEPVRRAQAVGALLGDFARVFVEISKIHYIFALQSRQAAPWGSPAAPGRGAARFLGAAGRRLHGGEAGGRVAPVALLRLSCGTKRAEGTGWTGLRDGAGEGLPRPWNTHSSSQYWRIVRSFGRMGFILTHSEMSFRVGII